MKFPHIIYLIVVFAFEINPAKAQDLIVKERGDSLNCKIMQIKRDSIYFVITKNNEKIIRVLSMSRVQHYKRDFFAPKAIRKEKVKENYKIGFQKAPAKYGYIDRADIEMKVYPADSSASAVILCDYGYFNARRFQFTRLLRIKILKKEGYAWADKIFSFRYEKPGIKGVTYNLENGVVVKSTLSSESIFIEKVKAKEFYRVHFAMPDVKEGSVIDMEIYYTGLPMEWRFQDVIPVRWSELIIEPTSSVIFQKTFFGAVPLQLNTSTRWVGLNMPAFKEEPHMSGISDYLTKMEIEISEIHPPYFFEVYASSWEAVNKRLLDYDAFGKGLGSTAFLNEQADRMKHSGKSKEEILKDAYESVKKIKWNKEEDIYISSVALKYASEKGIGNVADINLTLFQLLQKLDFEVQPVVLRTRDHGKFSTSIPTIDRLNYVVVQVKINDQTYLLDATEEFLPYGLLPGRSINGMGRSVGYTPQWVNLRASGKNKETANYDLRLNEENLSLNGKIIYKRNEYAAFNFRKKYHTFNSKEEYLDDFKKDKPGLKISKAEIQNADSIYAPLQDQYEVSMDHSVTEADGELYINPQLFNELKENPFKSDERNYPVDIPYLMEKSFTGTIKVPESYTLVSLPEAVKLQLPGNAASFVYQAAFVNNTIQFSCKFNVNKEVFLPEEYADLKEFYARLLKKNAEPVILKKN